MSNVGSIAEGLRIGALCHHYLPVKRGHGVGDTHVPYRYVTVRFLQLLLRYLVGIINCFKLSSNYLNT